MKKLLQFTAPWCGPCKTMAPIIDKLPSKGISVQKINADTDMKLCAEFNIRSIPTIVVVDENMKELRRVVGVQTEQQLINLYNG
jgi:thioredoxin-like negative regulator of GroEL